MSTIPDGAMLRDVRTHLRHADIGRLMDVARLLVENKVTAPETVLALFGTPQMKDSLGSDFEKIKAMVAECDKTDTR